MNEKPGSIVTIELRSPKREQVHMALAGAGIGNVVARRIAIDFDTGWLGRCCGSFDGVLVQAGRVRGRRLLRIATIGTAIDK